MCKKYTKKFGEAFYYGVAPHQYVSDYRIDITATKEHLSETLHKISGFAAKQELTEWQEGFDKARSVLDSPAPHEGFYHQGLVPQIITRCRPGSFYLPPDLPGFLAEWARGTIWVLKTRRTMTCTKIFLNNCMLL